MTNFEKIKAMSEIEFIRWLQAEAKDGVKSKYKIHIWMYGNVVAMHECDSLYGILEWYEEYWWECYDKGCCEFDVYRRDILLSHDELRKFGFYF